MYEATLNDYQCLFEHPSSISVCLFIYFLVIGFFFKESTRMFSNHVPTTLIIDHNQNTEWYSILPPF